MFSIKNIAILTLFMSGTSQASQGYKIIKASYPQLARSAALFNRVSQNYPLTQNSVRYRSTEHPSLSDISKNIARSITRGSQEKFDNALKAGNFPKVEKKPYLNHSRLNGAIANLESGIAQRAFFLYKTETTDGIKKKISEIESSYPSLNTAAEISSLVMALKALENNK